MSTAEGAPTERSAPPWRREGVRRALLDYAHLAVLSAFVLSQPIFNLLGKNPEFFAARGAPPFDVISFGFIVVLVPPAILLAIELLAGLVHPRARQGLHLFFIALGVTLFAAELLKKAIHGSDAVLIAVSVVIGIAAAAAYASTAGVRSFLSVLSPAPLVFLFIFLVVSPVSKVAFANEATAKSVGGVSRVNIVEVLFDEMPVTTLLDDHGQIDAKRFPAFAELARNSTWFKNAYTIYDSTERAQPAIFDGDLPAKDKLPTSADHPNSIFTLMAKTHRLNVSEEATSVCPRDLCKDERLDESYGSRMKSMGEDLGLVWLHVVSPPHIEGDLASVSENWGNFGGGDGGGGAGAPGDQPNTRSNLNRNRNKRFDEWIARIHNTSRPALNFKHSLLPHVPWQYLPDAKQYRRTARDPIPGISSESYKDPYQVESLYQRHMLQAGFADHELGKLLAHLKRTGLYDKSLIALATDHGVAFDVGKRDRRTLTRQNAEEIGPIPLFIKAPGQRKGRVDPAFAESIDILPTILDILNVHPRVHIDGKSAFSAAVRNRKRIRILQRNTFKSLYFDEADWEARRKVALERKLRFFGQGSDGPLRLFRIGPDQQLLFKPVSGLSVSNGSGARFAQPSEYKNVDLKSPTIPVHVTGYIDGLPTGRTLAIAVNGRIAAVTNSFHTAIDSKTLFAAMTPESFYKQGHNKVEVFEVTGPGSLRRLGST